MTARHGRVSVAAACSRRRVRTEECGWGLCEWRFAMWSCEAKNGRSWTDRIRRCRRCIEGGLQQRPRPSIPAGSTAMSCRDGRTDSRTTRQAACAGCVMRSEPRVSIHQARTTRAAGAAAGTAASALQCRPVVVVASSVNVQRHVAQYWRWGALPPRL